MSLKIKRFRIEKGLSQSEMAEKMCISQSGYAKLENGQSKLDVERLVEISKILDVDINDFIKTEEDISVNYNNSTITKSGIGYVNNMFMEMKDTYTKRIEHLEKEIEFLRNHIINKGK